MTQNKVRPALIGLLLLSFANKITAQNLLAGTRNATSKIQTISKDYSTTPDSATDSRLLQLPIKSNELYHKAAAILDTFKLSSVPVQISFTPGLGTQGKQGQHSINNFSLNILGGRTGGVNGVEMGGLLNMNTMYVRGVQVGGLSNLTGKYVEGVQVAGIHNYVAGNLKGVQVAGINNFVKGSTNGLQIGGIYNHANNEVKGIQVAGITNFAKANLNGIQISGIGNISREVNGMQVGGIFNYAKKLRGVQVGLVNFASESTGYSIGLLNFVPNGYHKLVISTNEIFEANAAYKSGNSKLYTIIIGGISTHNNARAYSFGWGLGKEIALTNMFSINPEISSQYVYLGTFKDYNSLNKINLDFHVKFGKHLSIFAGPVLAGYYKETKNSFPGYKTDIPKNSFNTFKISSNMVGWIGWNAGISFF
jgi:hypothetical protein